VKNTKAGEMSEDMNQRNMNVQEGEDAVKQIEPTSKEEMLLAFNDEHALVTLGKYGPTHSEFMRARNMKPLAELMDKAINNPATEVLDAIPPGTSIGILSNMDASGEEIYVLYKQRESVEVAFDVFKNEIDSDKTYLSDDDSVKGYFFVSFVALYLYFRVMEMLRQRGMLSRMSVKDVLHELSKVYLVWYNDDKEGFTEIPAKVERICQTLKLNLFPKMLRS